MSDDDLDDFDLDTETLNRIAATEAHFIASQKPKVSSLNTPPAVPSPEEGPPRKLTRRTGPSVTHSIAKDMQSVGNFPKSQSHRHPLSIDNSDRSFGASAQAKSTPVQHIPPSASPATTFARDNSAILAAELSRMRRQKDEEIEKRMQTSNQLKAQYEINYRAHGEIETVRRQALRDQEELKAQKEKLRAEVSRLQALNAELNTQNETSNEKMEIDMMFQRHEAETSARKQIRSTVSPQRRMSRTSSMGFPGLQNSFARKAAGSSRGKTAMPVPPISSRKDEMDWQSETNERRSHTQPRPTTSKNNSSDWEKFTHLLFNHLCCYPSTRAYRQLTIQLILNADVESLELDKYNKASVELLETFGEEVVEGRTDAAFAKVVKNLNIFVEVFLNCGMLTHLAETLALLASLIYENEKILDSLMSPAREADGGSLVLSIMKIVKKHLKPKSQVKGSEEMKGSQEVLEEMIQDNLTDCVLNFVETVVMHSQDSQTGKLMPLLRDATVIQTPLLSSQKPWCVYRWTRFLVFAAAHRMMTVGIVNQPRSKQLPNAENGYNSTLLHLLSGYLTTPHAKMRPIDKHKHLLLILTLLHTIIKNDEVMLTSLVDSKVLIPSLITLLTKDSGILWNEDNIVLYPSEDELSTENVIDRIIPLTQLINLLITNTNQTKFASKLQNNRPSFQHMCIVSLGRIAFAESPDFISDDYKEDLEYLSDIARDLLVLIISPDEGDMIYLTYNSDEE